MYCPLYDLSIVGVLLIGVNGSIGDVGGVLVGPSRGCLGESTSSISWLVSRTSERCETAVVICFLCVK